MLHRFVVGVVNRPWYIIALTAAVTLFFVSHLNKLEMQIEPDKQIPPDHPMVIVGQELEKDFGGKYITLITVTPKQGSIYTPKVLNKIKTISDRALTLPGLRTPGVSSIMAKSVQDVVVTTDDLAVKPLVGSIPETQEGMDRLRARIEQNRTVFGTLVSKDHRTASILIDFQDFEKAGGSKNCYPAIESIVKSERDQDTDIRVVGMPPMVYWYLVYTERVSFLFALVLLVIGFIQYRAFRTLQGTVIPIITAMLGVAWAMGMVGLVGAPLDPWNMMTPILVLAIAAGHSHQILKRYYEEYSHLRETEPHLSAKECNRQAVIQATTKIGGVMIAAGVIAFLSFASLVTFTLPSMRTFGLATAFGILGGLIMELTLIPAMRSLLPPPTERQTTREKKRNLFDPILKGLASLILNGHERKIVAFTAVLLIVAFIGALRMNVNNSMDAQFAESSQLIQDFRAVNQATSGAAPIQVLVDTNRADGVKDPDILRRMDQLQTFIQNQPKEARVGHVMSIVDFLKFMNRRMNEDKPAAEVLPTSAEAIGQYLLLFSMSGEKGDMDRFVDFNYRKASMVINLKTDEARTLEKFIKDVRGEIKTVFADSGARVEVGGGTAYLIALNETIIKGKIMNLIQIAALILITSMILLRSIVGGLFVLIPLFCSVIMNFGVMGWAGICLSMGSAAISAIAAGIGADYAIYFIFRMREEAPFSKDLRHAAAKTLTTSGRAIASIALAVGAAYLCLGLSGFKMHLLLGVLVALMMLSSSLGALGLLSSLLVWVAPRFLTVASQKEASKAPRMGDAGIAPADSLLLNWWKQAMNPSLMQAYKDEILATTSSGSAHGQASNPGSPVSRETLPPEGALVLGLPEPKGVPDKTSH